MSEAGETVALLNRWHGGDDAALNDLLERNLEWIERRVRQRLGAELRSKADTMDFVQDAMMEVLRYGPRFELASRAHFRALMVRIIENTLRGKHAWFQAARRQVAREKPLPSASVIRLDRSAHATVATPSLEIDRRERESYLRLAVELLDPDDRDVLVLREWRGLSFAQIGEELEMTEDAARMRLKRTLPKLASKMRLLQNGDLDELLREEDSEPSAP